MQSIHWIRDVEYYLNRATHDYYFRPGEPEGKWWGGGTAPLGLVGTVKPEDLRAVFKGFAPDGKPLIQNAGVTTGHKKHQQGWDLTFSAPKSVSVLWSQSNQETRELIQKLHHQAIQAVLEYQADVAFITRRGKDGLIHEKAQPIVAIFEHGSNRELEPHLHSHCVVANCARREDGSFGTILSKPLYDHKMTGGALYQAEFEHLLRTHLRLRTEKKEVGFAITGVPQELCDRHSTRAKQLRSMNPQSAKAAEKAAQATRKPKPDIPPSRAQLFQSWSEVNKQHRFTEASVQRLMGKLKAGKKPISVEQLARDAVTTLTEQQSVFSEQQVIRQAARDALGQGISARQIIDGVRGFLCHDSSIVPLAKQGIEASYTTKQMQELESKLKAAVQNGTKDTSNLANRRYVQRLLAAQLPIGWHLSEDDRIRNEEQRKAIEHLTLNPGNVQVLEGLAGTGKTFSLKLCNQAWRKSGKRVIGMALSGQAAKNLQDGSGIESETIALRLRQMDLAGDFRYHHKRQLLRALKGKRTFAYRGRRFKLNSNTVVVIDEAGMVGTKQLAAIMEHVRKAGAKLVLVGDRLQLQPIDAGSPFRMVAETVGAAKLSHVTRQKLDPSDPDPSWHRAAGKLIRDGHPDRAIKLFAERGRVSFLKERTDAMFTLVRDWSVNGIKNPTDNIILAAPKIEVRDLNLACQQARLRAGALGTKQVAIGINTFHELDTIVFNKIGRRYNVNNGTRGTILSFNRIMGTMKVRLDGSEECVVVSYRDFPHFDLGYAMTTHKAQGKTVPNVYVLLGGPMQDLHLSYVQTSRATDSTRLYIDELHAGPRLKDVLNQMARQHVKPNAVDLVTPEPGDVGSDAHCDSMYTPHARRYLVPNQEGKTIFRLPREFCHPSARREVHVDEIKARLRNPIWLTMNQHFIPNKLLEENRHRLISLCPRWWMTPKKRRLLRRLARVWRQRLNDAHWAEKYKGSIDWEWKDRNARAISGFPQSPRMSWSTSIGLNELRKDRMRRQKVRRDARKGKRTTPRWQTVRLWESEYLDRPNGRRIAYEDKSQAMNLQRTDSTLAPDTESHARELAQSPSPPTLAATFAADTQAPQGISQAKQRTPLLAEPPTEDAGTTDVDGSATVASMAAADRSLEPPQSENAPAQSSASLPEPRDVRDVSHVTVKVATDYRTLRATERRYGQLPGGFVVEGDAQCDVQITSLAIDPDQPSRLLINGGIAYDTGLTPVEVALLWHSVCETAIGVQDFGVLSQRHAIGIDDDTEVAVTMMEADNCLGKIVYGYDSQYELCPELFPSYVNPFVQETSEAVKLWPPRIGLTLLSDRRPQMYLSVDSSKFTRNGSNSIRSQTTAITAAIGVVNRKGRCGTGADTDFPFVYAAFQHFVKHFREYAQQFEQVARAIAYAELVHLLRHAKKVNAELSCPDQTQDLIRNRDIVDVPRFDFTVRSEEFVQVAAAAARSLSNFRSSDPYEVLMAAIAGFHYATAAGDVDAYQACKINATRCAHFVSDVVPKTLDAIDLRQELPTIHRRLATRCHDNLIDNCIARAFEPGRTADDRRAYLQEALTLCGDYATRYFCPITQCRWAEVMTYLDQAFDPIPVLADVRDHDTTNLQAYYSMTNIRCRRANGFFRDDMLDSLSPELTDIWTSIQARMSIDDQDTFLLRIRRFGFSLTQFLLAYRSRQSIDSDPGRALAQLAYVHLRTRPPHEIAMHMLHDENIFAAGHELLDREQSHRFKDLMTTLPESVETFGPKPTGLGSKIVSFLTRSESVPQAEKWWRGLEATYAHTAVNANKMKLLLGWELHVRRRTVGQLYEKMREYRTNNPQAALYLLDLEGYPPLIG